jgi:hypothetical protein
MKVATSPDFLQSVIDAVWHWVAQDDEPHVPLASAFEHVVGLEFEDGGFVFIPHGDTWEVHTLFLPGAKDPFSCAREAAAYVFSHGCERITTEVPADNVPADRLTRKMGFTLTHTEPQAFLRGGVLHDVHHYELRKDAWQEKQGCP